MANNKHYGYIGYIVSDFNEIATRKIKPGLRRKFNFPREYYNFARDFVSYLFLIKRFLPGAHSGRLQDVFYPILSSNERSILVRLAT